MKIERVTDLVIDGAKLIEFASILDERGRFTEMFRLSEVSEVIPGMNCCVQFNQSMSDANVVRGLHWQMNPPMGKMVRVIYGFMYDLLLDVRLNSKTFGVRQCIGMKDPMTWIWVPAGVAHGSFFPVKSGIEYLCSAEYNRDGEECINAPSVFDDLEGLDAEKCIMSDRDAIAPTFDEWKSLLKDQQ